MRERLLILLLALHVIFWTIFLRHTPFFRVPLSFLDLDAYLRLWRDILSGLNPYRPGQMMTLGPPLVLIPYFPWVFFPPVIAQLGFYLLNLYCGYLGTYLLVKGDAVKWLCLSLLLFLTFPVRFSLLLGQPALTVFLLVVLSLHSPSVIPSWSLTLIKTYFGFGLLSFVRREKGKLIQTLFTLVAVGFAFSPLLPISLYRQYLTAIFPKASLEVRPVGTDYYNQSLKSTLYRLNLLSYYPWIWGILICFGGMLTVLSGNLPLGLALGLWLSPILWPHYLPAFYPICFVFYLRVGKWGKLLLLLGLGLISVEIPWFHAAKLSLPIGLLASHMFWGLSLIVGLLAVVVAREIRLPRTQSEGNLS